MASIYNLFLYKLKTHVSFTIEISTNLIINLATFHEKLRPAMIQNVSQTPITNNVLCFVVIFANRHCNIVIIYELSYLEIEIKTEIY